MSNLDLDRDFKDVALEEDATKDTSLEEEVQKTKKKKKKGSILSFVLCFIGIGMMVYAGWNLHAFFKDYSDSKKLYDQLKNDFVTENTQSTQENTQDVESTEEIPWYERFTVDLEGVEAMNADTIGWFVHETEEISYPIMYSGDNSKYLRTGIDMQYATAGCLFVEGANNPDFQDSHTIIYGHNMRDLSMFGKLKYYHEEGYYENNQYFQIHTMNNIYRYQVFAYEVVEADSFVYSVPFAPGEEFANFLDKIYRKSEINSGVVATDTDKVIMLGTCTDDGNKRFVVFGVRVDAHGR